MAHRRLGHYAPALGLSWFGGPYRCQESLPPFMKWSCPRSTKSTSSPMKWWWWIFLANWFVFFGCKYPKMVLHMGWIWILLKKKKHIASTTNISRFNTSTVLDFQTWCLGTSAGTPLCLMGTDIYIYYTYIYILLDYLNKANPLNVTLDLDMSVQSLKFVDFLRLNPPYLPHFQTTDQRPGQASLPRSGKIWAAPWSIRKNYGKTLI